MHRLDANAGFCRSNGVEPNGARVSSAFQKSQGVERRCCGRVVAFRSAALTPLDHMHQLSFEEHGPFAAKGIHSEYRPHETFDDAVVSFDDVVEVL